MKPSHMLWVSPTSGVPIYRQLIDQIRALIATGKLAPGEFLPSVRQVAQELQINPMTVSKAYSQMELEGIVELVRGQGMRVKDQPPGTGPGNAALKQRQDAILPLLKQVASSAYQLSLSRKQVLALLDPLLKENEHG